MGSKYTRGKRIRNMAEYFKSTENGQRMFWIYQGRWLVRHTGWLESMQYRNLKMYVDHYNLYEAILRKNTEVNK